MKSVAFAGRPSGFQVNPRRITRSRRAEAGVAQRRDPRCTECRYDAGQEVDGQGRERVDVGRGGEVLAAEDFGSGEAGCAQPLLFLIDAHRRTEVDQHGTPVSGEHHVLRLHVTMDDGWGMPVQVVERVGDLVDECEHRGQRDAAVLVRGDEGMQVVAVHVVADHVVALAVDEVAADGRDARMSDGSHQRGRLAAQPAEVVAVDDEPRLQHDVEPELEVVRSVHLCLAASAEPTADFEPTADDAGEVALAGADGRSGDRAGGRTHESSRPDRSPLAASVD